MEGYRILYTDEFVTTKSTIPTHAWSLPYQPIKVDPNQYSSKAIASIISISEEAGIELIMNFEKSVNNDKFITYLVALRRKYPFYRLAVFLDRL